MAGSLASAFAPNGGSGDLALGLLAGCRFCLGFGIGGCYPLSAAKSAEEGGGSSVAERNLDVGLNLVWQVREKKQQAQRSSVWT